MKRKLLGEDHPEVAITLNNLAGTLGGKGDFDEAIALYRQVIALDRVTFGPDHVYVAVDLNNLAWALREKGDYAAAETVYREALPILKTELGAESVLRQGLDIRLDKLGAEHWQTGEAKSMLGRCLTALNRYDEAEPLLLDGYQTLEQALGAQDRSTLTALRRLVALYEASDQSAKASRYRALLG